MIAPRDITPPFYTDEELDALYERDPVGAMRISREQHLLRQQLDAARSQDPDAPLPTREEISGVLDEARGILLRDGGDIELVEIAGSVVRVRMKGNCCGCPRSALDLKQVVERLVRNRFPRVTKVENVF